MDIPLAEFDPAAEAFIEPARIVGRRRVPERMVVCFFREVIERTCAEAPVACRFRSEIGPNPVWLLGEGEDQVGVMHPGVGAPLAVGFLEAAIAAGARRIAVIGGAGALVPELTLGHVIVPTAAVRDEGTSFHYMPPGREVEADPQMVALTTAFLDRREVPYSLAKTWTTDALYRETAARIERRRAEGCATVEMETSAFFAVARFRGVRLTQLLYAGDSLAGDQWDHRGWMSAADTRDALFWLTVDLAREL
ncbi:MAG: nucleoside phosphorylase [Acidimicrobiia bacterium]|nr:nucleoside phosphorylase [Acidimicrobiia bacterium]